jgi:hypothetical protein
MRGTGFTGAGEAALNGFENRPFNSAQCQGVARPASWLSSKRLICPRGHLPTPPQCGEGELRKVCGVNLPAKHKPDVQMISCAPYTTPSIRPSAQVLYYRARDHGNEWWENDHVVLVLW